MINITYPSKLQYVLDKSKTPFLPKKVPRKQKQFKLFHKYYYSEYISDSYFKVIDEYYVGDDKYITISFSDNIYWSIPADITDYNNLYELIYDKNNILKKKIINSKDSYSGYEILYWFNNKYNYKYSEFKPYIEDGGKCRVNENYNYFISADYINRKYTNVRFKIDRRK
jgi:hypothetical protein